MTRAGMLERLLENLEIASANLLRDPRNAGAKDQVRAALDAVRAFRRMEAATVELRLAEASLDAVHEPVPARLSVPSEDAPSPVVLAEQTGRCGYKDAD